MLTWLAFVKSNENVLPYSTLSLVIPELQSIYLRCRGQKLIGFAFVWNKGQVESF